MWERFAVFSARSYLDILGARTPADIPTLRLPQCIPDIRSPEGESQFGTLLAMVVLAPFLVPGRSLKMHHQDSASRQTASQLQQTEITIQHIQEFFRFWISLWESPCRRAVKSIASWTPLVWHRAIITHAIQLAAYRRAVTYAEEWTSSDPRPPLHPFLVHGDERYPFWASICNHIRSIFPDSWAHFFIVITEEEGERLPTSLHGASPTAAQPSPLRGLAPLPIPRRTSSTVWDQYLHSARPPATYPPLGNDRLSSTCQLTPPQIGEWLCPSHDP